MKNYILVVVVAFGMIFGLNSCAKKTASIGKTEPAVIIGNSPAVENTGMNETQGTIVEPEKKGLLEIKRDVNSNYVIHLNLMDLEELSNIKPDPKIAYIVWMDAENQATKSLGQISSNTAWLSDKSKASFEATSVLKPTKVFITKETSATVQKPGTKLIWTTRTF